MKPMLRVIIADDEPLARQFLRRMLDKHPDVSIVGESANGVSAVEDIRRLRPDLVLLDVQMPGKNGFDVVRELQPEELPRVIFVTAYDQYALNAFEVHAIDYLLKPFDDHRLAAALDRAREHFGLRNSADDTSRLIRLLESVQNASRYAERLPVKSQGRTLLLPVSEIHLLEATGKFVRIVAASGEYTVRQALGSLEQRLNPAEFIRVSRSSIVNVGSIRELQQGGRGEYLMTLGNGERVQTTRSYRDSIAGLIGDDGE